jgi:hypothetical protein
MAGFKGEVTVDEYRGIRSVPYALGQLAYHGDAAALQYLLAASGSDLATTETAWTFNGQEQSRQIYKATLLALGVSGTAKGRARLLEIEAGDNLTTQETGSLDFALLLNRKVNGEGMAATVNVDPNGIPPRTSCKRRRKTQTRIRTCIASRWPGTPLKAGWLPTVRLTIFC